MCGIAGILTPQPSRADVLVERAAAMTDTLVHRGPDAGDVWTDCDAGIALGNRRLAVVELSPAGAQPMHSSNGRWVAAYNGELYNTEDLRREIEAKQAVAWRGHSDTEVILEAASLWGTRGAVERFNGMFALALWDRNERRLWLMRDRAGIKPLYWARLPDGTILFGSELRSLRAHPAFVARINPEAVAAYMRSACVPAPLAIYEHTYKLLPAHVLSVSMKGEPAISCYWDIRHIAATGQREPESRSDDELVDELQGLLADAVGRQMISDVPLGAFLSGGIDSSAVAALMQAQSPQPIRTFSIGFHDKRYNEAEHANAVARHLGTDHTELIVEPAHALAVTGRLPEIYDEPFADSSQIPTFLVSELARRHVTVALSGDGGDECFGGYVRHQWVDRIAKWDRIVPKPLSRAIGKGLRIASPAMWDALLALSQQGRKTAFAGNKIHKAAALLGLGDGAEVYAQMIAQWPDPRALMPGTSEPRGRWFDPAIAKDMPDAMARLRFFDMIHYLPDDILTKVDRASMAVSLEARVPLLDHRVIEYSWRLPRNALIRGSTSKWLLRQVLWRYVPRALIERPKAGFAIPIGDWIRGPLSEWADDLLSETALQSTGLFDVALVRGMFAEHQSRRQDWQYPLWTMLMFQAWHKRWMAAAI